ncbi:uncharacterized protein LOC116209786 isoform X2 [Punica granatum]|uniref:Uncharacterized protein LOC116209786 isoform X2 n=1 Tax=Punica granatum TaxID=22663 RepID=A0A6P8DYC9_PUNGR|nr:uncharacterized protein LOC116209786 isoform X2 [Punica granatum]
MGYCRGEEDYGCYCCATTSAVRPSESINLSAYTRGSWFRNGIFVEVGSKLECINLLVHARSGSRSFGITINLHATISILFTASGINIIPSMDLIYAIFGIVLLLNSVFLVFLLHLLYSVFFTRLGMRSSLNLPRWLEKAI